MMIFNDDFRWEELAALPGQSEPNSGGGVVLVPDLNSGIDFPRVEPAVQVGVEGQGEPNPGGGSVAVEFPNLISTFDYQQDERAGLVEGAGRGDANAVGNNVVVQPHAPNNVDDFRPEVAVPVEAREDIEEPAEQLASGSLSQERVADDADSLGCPICLEPWTNSGEHRICSLHCGHLFGRSCISGWQCNNQAKMKDLRNLYVPRVLSVADAVVQNLGKEIRTVKEENQRVKEENRRLVKAAKLVEAAKLVLGKEIRTVKEENQRMKEENRRLVKAAKLVEAAKLQPLAGNSARTHFIEESDLTNSTGGSERLQNVSYQVVGSTEAPTRRRIHSGPASDSRTMLSAISSSRQHHLHPEGGSTVAGPQSSSSSSHAAGGFQVLNEVRVDGGRVFEMDAESLTVIFSNKIEGIGSSSGLSRMSMLSCTAIEKIHLPPGFGEIRDIRLCPRGVGRSGKCALVASTGKLSLLSLQSNEIVLSYSDVQSPPWSCAWDPSAPNLCYSGLQNGALLLVDLRQTSSPVAMLNGPSAHPLHTLQVLQGQFPHQATFGRPFPGGREILGASNSAISLWHLEPSFSGSAIARPQCVYSERDIVCFSLAYECSINTAVASLRGSPRAQAESSEPSGPSSSFNEGLSTRSPSQLANDSWEEPRHCKFSRGQERSWSEHLGGTVRPPNIRLPWEGQGEMVGNRSQSLMSRTAIVPVSPAAPRSTSLFACGDDRTNSVWLWDMTSCGIIDTLVPHQSPVLDVKNVQIEGQSVLGCVSEETFQLYIRTPLLE